MSPIFTTALQTRQLVSFYDPLNQGSTLFSPKLNPAVITRKPGSVRKYAKTINGTSVLKGQWEYPPTEILLTWNQIDQADYLSLAYFTSLSPVVFVDNNDKGFLGALVFDEADQIAGLSMNVWTVKASFLVIAPYNGNSTSINQLAPPTLTSSVVTPGGYVPASTTLYVWPTVNTPWGESAVGSSIALTAASANTYFNVTWTNPTSTWYRYTSLYWNTANTAATATLLMQGLPAQSGSFTIYGAYQNYTTQNPPIYGTAFTGQWRGGSWVQSS